MGVINSATRLQQPFRIGDETNIYNFREDAAITGCSFLRLRGSYATHLQQAARTKSTDQKQVNKGKRRANDQNPRLHPRQYP
jgi:hypothetical protein